MRWKATLAGAALVLITGTACAGHATDSQQSALGREPSASVTTPAGERPQPPDAPGSKPVAAPGGAALPESRLDGSALPEGFPKQVSVGRDGRLLFVGAEEGGCGRASAELVEQNAERVVVKLVETKPAGGRMCTQDMRYPVLSVRLAEPLGARTVVLQRELRKQ
jgi:hypothetical protein